MWQLITSKTLRKCIQFIIMHNMESYPVGRIFFFFHFAQLCAIHSINDHFNFAHVSITLIIYWDSPLMTKSLVWFIQLRNMPENFQPNKLSFCSVHRLVHCVTLCHPLPLRQSLPVILSVLSFCHSNRNCCFMLLFVYRNSVVASFYLLIYSNLHLSSHCILFSHWAPYLLLIFFLTSAYEQN